MSDGIIKLPLKSKDRTPERLLKVVGKVKCQHGQYMVDDKLDHVECGKCGEHLNPMWVLKQIANTETREHRAHMAIKRKLKEVKAKSKWKCGCCGKFNDMTQVAKWRGIK